MKPLTIDRVLVHALVLFIAFLALARNYSGTVMLTFLAAYLLGAVTDAVARGRRL